MYGFHHFELIETCFVAQEMADPMDVYVCAVSGLESAFFKPILPLLLVGLPHLSHLLRTNEHTVLEG